MRGTILCNGNLSSEAELVRVAAERLLESRHQEAAVAASRKVLLVTAGWEEHEYDEGHVKRALYDVGVAPRMENGYDANVQNLSAWHAYQEFCALEPALAVEWRVRERLIDAARRQYLEKNGFYVALLRRALAQLKELAAGYSLAQVMADVTRSFTHPPADFESDRMMAYYVGRDLRDTVDRLLENDDRMVELLHDLDDHFADAVGLHYNEHWRRLRRALEEKVLSANSVLLLGGSLGALHRCLHFFRLRDAMAEALRRGTCFYASSAGALLLCERIIVYNDFPSEFGPRREFQLFDRGFGLVRELQIFPHCTDRIQTDDPDHLAYLAYRFQNRTCVGLNEASFLLIESDPRPRFTSVGAGDGVYVFDPSGTKLRYDRGQEIAPG